jgi:Rrf2 family protein
MKILSRPAHYSIQASLYIASRAKGRPFVPVKEISAQLGISFYFLAKIIQALVKAGIFSSYKGPHGGVSLAKPAGEITLMDLVSAIEGEDCFDDCLLGLPGCGEEKPCPLHDSWDSIRGTLKAMFRTTTLADLAARLEREDLRLGLA